jgi:hypothetical protein
VPLATGSGRVNCSHYTDRSIQVGKRSHRFSRFNAMASIPTIVKPPHDEAPATGGAAMTSQEIHGLNARLTERRKKWGGLRTHRSFFRCPWPCTKSQYEQIRNAAAKRWLEDMDKRGWTLRSKVYGSANRREPAYDYSGDWMSVPLPDKVQIPMAALFEQRNVKSSGFEMATTG